MPSPKHLVINTGPMLALIAAFGDLRILSYQYQKVVVPQEVCMEIETGGKTRFGVEEFRAATWLHKRTKPIILSPLLSRVLDGGEASVIQTALNEQIDVVCIDESVGRRFARLHGLSLTGSIGILLRAKQEGRLTSVKETMVRMQKQGVWISTRVIDFALAQTGEN